MVSRIQLEHDILQLARRLCVSYTTYLQLVTYVRIARRSAATQDFAAG